MRMEERLAIKLLAQASALLGKAVNEALCTEPDRHLVQSMAQDAAALIQEFNEHYFDSNGSASASTRME